mmetsp:Transcript_50081/g.119146  ORF Transcript_50081/g.119146 Transcript_50081/m.119146 type:complete len:110 (-) Transcript_50081:139-468(-)
MASGLAPEVVGKTTEDLEDTSGNKNEENGDHPTVSGRVKFFAFFFLFLVWVGGWGFTDLFVETIGARVGLKVSFFLYAAMSIGGLVGLKILANRYRGYALLDEIQDMPY